MRVIPQATPITLTDEERRELEALAGSRKSEARMRERARIVLLAADGLASRAVGREVGCTPGTASKWRVRYARDRMAGLSETENRGADAKYGPHDKRILAMLDRPPPAGCANWTARLLARELGDVHEQYICSVANLVFAGRDGAERGWGGTVSDFKGRHFEGEIVLWAVRKPRAQRKVGGVCRLQTYSGLSRL
jgi:transposase